MYRIESSGPFSDPVAKELVKFGLPSRGFSRVCGHPCHYCWDGGYDVPGGYVRKRFEICPDCVVTRGLAIAEGKGAEEYLELVIRLALPPAFVRESMGHEDDFTEFDFWQAYVSQGGRAEALDLAAEHGYRLPAAN